MSTLAQRLMEGKLHRFGLRDKFGLWAMEFLRDAFYPYQDDVVDIPHVKSRAESFRFNEDIGMLAFDLIKEKSLDWATVYTQAQIPAPVMWMEWPCETDEGQLNYGALINSEFRSPRITVALYAEDLSQDLRGPVQIAHLEPFPQKLIMSSDNRSGIEITETWTMGHAAGDPEFDQHHYNFQCAMQDVFSGLFFLSIPRVAEIREVKHPEKIQKRRIHNRKKPLIEYRQVKLTIGRASPRYNSVAPSGESDMHKKLHRVIGHNRVYRKGRDQPRVSWVPPHWRGDEKLGVVLHHREVSKNSMNDLITKA